MQIERTFTLISKIRHYKQLVTRFYKPSKGYLDITSFISSYNKHEARISFDSTDPGKIFICFEVNIFEFSDHSTGSDCFFLTDDDKYKKDLDLDKWYPLQTDVGLLVFTKTAGDFDFELHYDCRGYHMVKEWIHGLRLHYMC